MSKPEMAANILKSCCTLSTYVVHSKKCAQQNAQLKIYNLFTTCKNKGTLQECLGT